MCEVRTLKQSSLPLALWLILQLVSAKIGIKLIVEVTEQRKFN